MDWNLRHCARKGHVTYGPTEAPLRDRLRADTPVGEAWRCLRCATFVPGPVQATGPAADAPVLLRGRALRSAVILRVLAVERWVRAAVLVLLGLAVLRLRTTQVGLKALFDRDLSALRPFFAQIHFDVSDSSTIRSVQKVLDAKSSTLGEVGAALIAYGALQLLEGIGLWSMRRWGEYVAVVGTTAFVPLEVYEIVDRPTWLKAVLLAVNVAAVVYLIAGKRLFGVRGGHEAYERALHAESLLEIRDAGDR